MQMKNLIPLTAVSLALVFTNACNAQTKKSYTFGLVAKSQSNPVFQAARVGAEDAAKELGAKYGVTIKIDWCTPNDEDAQKQADAMEQLVLNGADGIAVRSTDANKTTDAINHAVDSGVPVSAFDSDAPNSKRFVMYGVDDIQCGQQVMEELAKELGGDRKSTRLNSSHTVI